MRAASGRWHYLILYGQAPLLLSRSEYATVGDAKSAGKIKARELSKDRSEIALTPFHVAMAGYCHECIRQAQLRKAATENSSLCREHWEAAHPGKLEKFLSEIG